MTTIDTDRLAALDACLVWQGRRDENGYGWTSHNRRAHRVAWEEATGRAIPQGMVVMHACDNPPCVNPMHLRLGTVADNNRDRAAKGRSRGTFQPGSGHPAAKRRGARHWQAKLTDADVREIRRRRAQGEPLQDLADTFGVHGATISRIARRVWRQEVN